MNPLISLVSGTYNRLNMLQRMVQSFHDNLLPGIEYEVVLVDAGSTDGTIEWAKAQKDIVLIEDGKRLGAISAFTRGAYRATGKYVLLANDDVTFRPNAIIPALTHLENNPRCGAVAFKDNRPIPNVYGPNDYKVLRMSALLPLDVMPSVYTANRIMQVDNKVYMSASIIYAQVGLFRKWLGDEVGWWLGAHNEMGGAWTYGADNSLSAQIWHVGYTVDEVAESIVEDHIAMDELRQHNYEKGVENDDSKYFYQQWPNGVIVSNEPQIPQKDRRAARILYLPIYEPGWAVQKHPIHGKNGLRNALMRAKNKFGQNHIVQEIDYLAIGKNDIRAKLIEIVEGFKPDLILTQIQSPYPITADLLTELKARSGATIINWNGDQAMGGLVSPDMLNLLHKVDLQLIINMEAVPYYDANNIKWAYWQIGFEQPPGNIESNVRDYFSELGRPNPCEYIGQYPVVYLANIRSPERQAIAKIVEEFGGKVFQPGDEIPTLYNFSTSTYIYQHAKIAISDNGFKSPGFVSNRLFQALAAGGCCVLQQKVDQLDELTGLQAGFHYGEWESLADLRELIQVTLEPKNEELRKQVADNGTQFIREHYSFDAQVAELFDIIKDMLGGNEQMSNTVALKYIGRSKDSFGLGDGFPSRTRYEYKAGNLMFVKSEDVDSLITMYPNQWERMNLE